MRIPFVRLRPDRGRMSQATPLPYRLCERRADRRAAKADGRKMLPDYRDPKPTPTINERNDEFVKAAMSELESCLVDTADWCVKRARLASAIEIAQPDAQSSANGDAKDRIAWRLEKLNGLKSKIDEREKQYDTAREAHSAHARCRMDAYASMLTRIHPYRERLGDRLHQLVITEHERARRRLNELEQQVRRAATGAK